MIGVVISGTELYPGDEKKLEGINKPLVVYDADLGEKYPCILFNNAEAVKQAVGRLVNRGMNNILYLARSIDIHNYVRRRAGFCEGLREAGQMCIRDRRLPRWRSSAKTPRCRCGNKSMMRRSGRKDILIF